MHYYQGDFGAPLSKELLTARNEFKWKARCIQVAILLLETNGSPSCGTSLPTKTMPYESPQVLHNSSGTFSNCPIDSRIYACKGEQILELDIRNHTDGV
jgi:hypothetical protein